MYVHMGVVLLRNGCVDNNLSLLQKQVVPDFAGKSGREADPGRHAETAPPAAPALSVQPDLELLLLLDLLGSV